MNAITAQAKDPQYCVQRNAIILVTWSMPV